jgi:alpha-D-xyloside xylohydrolase
MQPDAIPVSAAVEAHSKSGIPVHARHDAGFPEDDPGCDTLDRQYMLGDQLLVAPVFSDQGAVDYYLPPGVWTNFLTGEQKTGGRWVREQHDFFHLPLMARPNAVIPVGANAERPDYDFSDGVTFHVFEMQDGTQQAVRVPNLDGSEAMTLEASRQANRLTFHSSAPGKAWQVLLRNIPHVSAITGGRIQTHPMGSLAQPDSAPGSIEIDL